MTAVAVASSASLRSLGTVRGVYFARRGASGSAGGHCSGIEE
jgi:hypothetical protein